MWDKPRSHWKKEEEKFPNLTILQKFLNKYAKISKYPYLKSYPKTQGNIEKKKNKLANFITNHLQSENLKPLYNIRKTKNKTPYILRL